MPQFLIENLDYVIGIFVLIATVLGMQFKSMRWILVFQILSNVLLGLQCIVGGTVSTGGVVFLAVVQTVISFVYNRKEKRFPLWLSLAFMAGYSAITVIGFISPKIASSPFDLITMVAVWFFALCIVQEKSHLCRIFSAINVALWLIYDFAVLPSAALNHVIILASIAVSIIRNDRAEWKAMYRRMFRKSKEDFSKK